jgi:hypothetical protein
MSALGLWIILAIAILLVRENRDPRVLLIFIPIYLVRLSWSRFEPILDAPSDIMAVLKVMMDALVIGIALLWLLAYKFGNRNRFVSLLLVLVVLAGLTVVAVVSYQVWDSFMDYELVTLQSLWIATFLLIFVLSGWRCRKQYGPWRFMLWLAFWTIAISLVVIIAFFLIAEGPSEPIGQIIRQMPRVLLVAVIFAFCIYMLNLPFMILAFVSPFFRARFYAYFHLKSMPTGPSSGKSTDEAMD